MTRYSVGTGLGALLLAVALAACSVDERALLLRSGVGGDGSIGGSAGFAEGPRADAGAAGSPTAPLPACDYSASIAPGCETLVSNPGFAQDTAGWDAEMPSISMAWNSNDAAQASGSGSLAVVNALSGKADGIADRGAAQCLTASPRQAYGFAADVFIPDNQGAGLDGGTFDASAGLSIIFYALDGCIGYSVSNATSEVLTQTGVWSHEEGHAIAPKEAQSMLVRLDTLKNFRQYTFEARFDNVLVKPE